MRIIAEHNGNITIQLDRSEVGTLMKLNKVPTSILSEMMSAPSYVEAQRVHSFADYLANAWEHYLNKKKLLELLPED